MVCALGFQDKRRTNEGRQNRTRSSAACVFFPEGPWPAGTLSARFAAATARAYNGPVSPGDTTERLAALCAEVGFDLRSVDASVLARLELLSERTHTVGDCEQSVDRARRIFRYYEQTKPGLAFSDGERRIVVLGSLFSDIGKTGPASASPAGQRLIAEMFAVEGVRDDQQSVAAFLNTYFPHDAEERIAGFGELGLRVDMTIREFWNLHSSWTLQIVESGGIPPEAIAAAATHHLLEDINPDAIVASDRRFTRPFGDNVAFDRAEKLVILLDKYDALRRRARRTHEQAIAWLHQRVESHPRFRGDHEFSTLIGDLEAALSAD